MSVYAPGFLFEQAGELLTAVLIEHSDGAPPATVTIGQHRSTPLQPAFRAGLSRIGLPCADAARSVEVVVERADGTTYRETVTVPAARRQVAHLVHLAHQDPGWADRPRILRDRMIPFLDEAVAYADATAGYPDDARFRWNVESAYLIDDYVAARPADAVERLVEAIRAGSIEVSALYAGVQSEFAGTEQLFRSADAGRRLATRYGFRCAARSSTTSPASPGRCRPRSLPQASSISSGAQIRSARSPTTTPRRSIACAAPTAAPACSPGRRPTPTSRRGTSWGSPPCGASVPSRD